MQPLDHHLGIVESNSKPYSKQHQNLPSVSPKFMSNAEPMNMTYFGNRVFEDIIKLK